MASEGKDPEPRILNQLAAFHDALKAGDRYELANGRWSPEQITRMLELRKQALELTIEAVKAGHNRGTIVETMLSYFNIEPHWPRF